MMSLQMTQHWRLLQAPALWNSHPQKMDITGSFELEVEDKHNILRKGKNWIIYEDDELSELEGEELKQSVMLVM